MPTPVSALRRNVRLLQWFNFFQDFRPYGPFIVLYFGRVTGSFGLGMSVIALSMVSSSAFEVPTGVLSDLVGRVRTMMLGALTTAIGMTLWSLGDTFPVLAFGSVFMGLGAALASGNNVAFLHDTLKQDGREAEYAHFLGRTSALFQVGLGTSALLGGVLALHSLRATMWAGVVPPLLCVLFTFFMVEPRVHGDEISTNVFQHLGAALRRFRENARLRNLSLGSMLDWGMGQALWDFLPIFIGGLWPVWAIGLFRGISNAEAAVSYWVAGRVVRRIEPFKTLICIRIISNVFSVTAYLLRSALSPFLLIILSSMYGVKCVSEGTLLQREFSDRERATLGSLNQLGGSIIFAVASVGLGFIGDTYGVATALIVGEIILFAGLSFYVLAFYSTHRSKLFK